MSEKTLHRIAFNPMTQIEGCSSLMGAQSDTSGVPEYGHKDAPAHSSKRANNDELVHETQVRESGSPLVGVVECA